MDDRQIKEKIEQAMYAPDVPQSLVERTAVRAKAITEGREAERQMAQMGSERLSGYPELAAKSVLGRLMLFRQPPKGATFEKMVSELSGNEMFRENIDSPADSFLADLQSGRAFSRFNPQPKKAAEAAKPERMKPVVDKQIPVKGGPQI